MYTLHVSFHKSEGDPSPCFVSTHLTPTGGRKAGSRHSQGHPVPISSPKWRRSQASCSKHPFSHQTDLSRPLRGFVSVCNFAHVLVIGGHCSFLNTNCNLCNLCLFFAHLCCYYFLGGWPVFLELQFSIIVAQWNHVGSFRCGSYPQRSWFNWFGVEAGY